MRKTNASRREFLCQAAAGTLAAAALGREAPAAQPPSAPGRVVRCPASYYQQFDADYAPRGAGRGLRWLAAHRDRTRPRPHGVGLHARLGDGHSRAVSRLVPCRRVHSPRSGNLPHGLPPAPDRGAQRGGHAVPCRRRRELLPDVAGLPGAATLAGPPPPAPETVPADASLKKLQELRNQRVFVGPHNAADVQRGFAKLDFPAEARPVGDEGVAESGHQLLALCKHHGINHLVYFGFAINWCLLMSPGGMLDMSGHGVMCSAIRQATTAVENRESARQQWAKELGLWRVALAWGFVFDVDDLVACARWVLASPPTGKWRTTWCSHG